MSRRFGSLVTIAAAIVFALVAYRHLGGQTRTLITHAIDENNLVTLRGNTHPAARQENDRGPVADSMRMDGVWLLLKRPPEKQKAFEKFLDEQQDPNSPNFHKWLTAKQVGDEFGPAQEDIATVTRWLQSSGFTVNHVYPHGLLIDFSGTAGQIRQAFHTEIHNFEVHGERHYANVNDPQIPEALAQAVFGPVSLHNFMPKKMLLPVTNYTVGSATNLVVPGDLGTIYNLPLGTYTGTGVTVVVIEDTDVYTTADFGVFRKQFGLARPYPNGTFTQVHPAIGTTVGGQPALACTDPGFNGDEGEAILDAEWASAAAPNASIVLASCANTSNFGGFIALQNLLTNGGSIPHVVSISYGEGETELGSTTNAYIASLYSQAATEGVSLFTSSGDSGAAVDDQDEPYATHGIQVSGFTSTPYNVSVGGTDFGDTVTTTVSTYWNSANGTYYNSAKSYIPEIPWNTSCAGQLLAHFETGSTLTYGSTGFCNTATGEGFLTTAAGSGGASTVYLSKPAFQNGFVGNPADGVRDVPDVSLFAANGLWGHYYVYCDSDPSDGFGVCSAAPSTWAGAGGTSFASPIMAGIMALVVQKKGGLHQGNPLMRMYAMAGTTYGGASLANCNSSLGNTISASCIFHDVTMGDMDVPCRGASNCFLPSGTNGVLSTSNSSYLPAYGTGTGYDFATGIGTVNAANFVNTF